MARVFSFGEPDRPLDGPWEMLLTPAGAFGEPPPLPLPLAGRGRGGGGAEGTAETSPAPPPPPTPPHKGEESRVVASEASSTDWMPASVPGTAVGALRAAGLWSDDAPTALHDKDVWYHSRFAGSGREVLRFEGLATLAEIWLNGVLVLTSRSMFLAHTVEVELAGDNDLVIAFRSLAAELARPSKRGRWRPRLATPGSLRHVRTSLLGFMPGWCPSVDAVGPYRSITRRRAGAPRVVSADLRATLDHGTGRLAACLVLEGAEGPARLVCDGREVALNEPVPGRFEGELLLPGVAPWWPHTHGEPRLHGVEVFIGEMRLDLGRVGFRTIALTRPFEEGLSLSVNGAPVFCRGASWMPADLVGLPGDAESYRPLLGLAREAGMNMLRVSGITLYESPAFHALCDEFGILVWQDLMLANFDYPTDDPAFRDALVAEIEQLLDRTQASPSLCVIGGGSEVFQQAAMLGAPREVWEGRFVSETLPRLVADKRPDLIVAPNSPCGGDLPFSTSVGVTHYYGVGAYRRPLEDARRAEVGFATECLAFANVPEPVTLAEAGLTDPTDPRWAAAIPRDRGADWDFEEVRDHYVATLFGADPQRLRADDPERYLQLGRAAVAEVMEATFSEWRRARSPTAGGLVWFLRDLAPGAGWGVIDSAGRPKSAWYALKRAFRPVQVTLSDEGLNGLHVHVHNETAEPRSLTLRLAFSDTDGRIVAKAERAIEMAPQTSRTWSSAELLSRFFDATDAYRFGPAIHTLGHASLSDPRDGAVLAEAFHVPQGRDAEPRPIGLAADLIHDEVGWALDIRAERHALCVHIETSGEPRPADNFFHLAPGTIRRIALIGGAACPRGTVRAVNGSERVRFGGDVG